MYNPDMATTKSQSGTVGGGAIIDPAALERDFEVMATIGRGDDGGFNRMAYSAADREAREWLIGTMRACGLDVRVDAVGNIIGSYAGSESGLKPIAIGSHTDSVPSGGNYDGVLGVLGGVACVRALHAAGVRLRHPIEVIDFAAEEATMPGGTVGSRAMAGQLAQQNLDAPAYDGRSLADHLRGAGLDPAAFATARRDRGAFAAYLELHIEQGGVLEAEGTPIGIVEGIVGIRRYVVTFAGKANHAGTTPMKGRRDALVFAAPFIEAVRDIAIGHEIVGTVGAMQIFPGAVSVIPGRVLVDVEIRGLESAGLDAAEKDLRQFAEAAGAQFERKSNKAPVSSAPSIMTCVAEACGELRLQHRVMPSGAGHDAMCVAAIAPQGMIFVPSRDGISHAPEEFTDPEQCLSGARVLLATLLRIDASYS
jgi:N-carbamoyl-L-amino-acid hydrolase